MGVIRRFTPVELEEIKIRRQRGESIITIAAALGRKKEAVWYHVRRINSPLPAPPSTEQLSMRGRRGGAALRLKWQGVKEKRLLAGSTLWKLSEKRYCSLSRTVKGKIAETAVLLRLLLLGARAYHPICEDDTSDWLVVLNGKTLRIQVRLAQFTSGPGSSEYIKLTSRDKKKMRILTKADCDFFIGYSLVKDTCYVIPVATATKQTVSLIDQHKENWEQLL